MNFDEFWSRHYKRLTADLVQFGRLPQDAEELAGQVLEKVWPSIQKVPPAAHWVYVRTAGRRAAINHHRNENAQVRSAELTAPLDELRDAQSRSTPEDLAIARQEIARLHAGIRAALAELPEETRLYIYLRRRNATYQQIADRLGVRIPAVQSRLYRATQHFLERLGPPPAGLTWIELAGELIDDHER